MKTKLLFTLGVLLTALVSGHAQTTFTKVTTGAVVTDKGDSYGGTWGDYNNDGFLDLFVFNSAGASTFPFLYRNNGDGALTKITSGPPVSLPVDSPASCWGDYDNDGNLDLFVATHSVNLLYHNSGDGTFTRVLTGPLVTGFAYHMGASWGDYDNDGFLDLFVTVFVNAANAHNSLYRNNGDGTFTQITNGSPVTDIGSSLGCTWVDYDNDGLDDLFVCAGRGPGYGLQPNRLYHNNGDGTFTRILTGSIATDGGYSGPCAWGDYDNDGFPDLFVGNTGGVPNFLYHNNGDGTFTRITNGIVGTAVATSFGCAWGDFDNDGYLDLFVANYGDLNNNNAGTNFLYHNNGDGTFTRITTGSPVTDSSFSIGCSWVDYDNDGFLDLFVAQDLALGNYLYHNDGNSNAWLEVKLVGTVSNRSAIGAKVRVHATIGGKTFWQLREINTGSGWGNNNPLVAHFGLGDATNADIVRIEWPSGLVQEFQNVAPKQILTYTEPPRLLASVTGGVPQFSLKGGRGFQYEVDSSSDLSTWSPIGSLTITNMNGMAQIVDTNPPASDQRFYRTVSQ
jgi:enediyne biosynthesis protein E4